MGTLTITTKGIPPEFAVTRMSISECVTLMCTIFLEAELRSSSSPVITEGTYVLKPLILSHPRREYISNFLRTRVVIISKWKDSSPTCGIAIALFP